MCTDDDNMSTASFCVQLGEDGENEETETRAAEERETRNDISSNGL